MQIPTFIDRLVDWQDFEHFVRDIYERTPDLTVEHNVVEKGRSGATRQTDVKFTHRVAGATYTTLVECKRWKEKVTRDRIDVLAASVEDLGASKGIMFTTTGYESGAEAYARDKSIDLFVVRDLLDDEWGAPGRVVSFWMHYYNGHFGDLRTKSKLLSFISPPVVPKLDLRMSPEEALDDSLTLLSFDGKQTGPNLLSVCIEARRRVLEMVCAEIRDLFADGKKDAQRAIRVPVEIDFSRSPTRSLQVEGGRLDIDSVGGELLVTIHQSQFEHDRGQNLDFILAVEHFMTKQRQIVLRAKNDASMAVHDAGDTHREDVGDAITPNTLFRIVLEAWVNPSEVTSEIESGQPVRFELPDWTTVVGRIGS
ncbi:MAG: restriction endonuclease [Solirubrobacterales bacterium]